jgi:hypothetical protein
VQRDAEEVHASTSKWEREADTGNSLGLLSVGAGPRKLEYGMEMEMEMGFHELVLGVLGLGAKAD